MLSRKAAACLLAAALSLAVRAQEPTAEATPRDGTPTEGPAAKDVPVDGVREKAEDGGAAAAPATRAGQGGAAVAQALPATETPATGTAPGAAAPSADDPKAFGESISVTATRAPRRTRDVPQAIAVIGKEQFEDSIVTNVKDVIAGTPGVLVESKNGGYDARLLIRGAGLKANYGIREIMILRDGVPLTDPDSFSRLDWIDTQDIERIEVSKGPGNLFSPGSAGGALQIISRSVFDPGADVAEAGLGTQESMNLHLRASGTLKGNALALTASIRRQDNPWRLWNEFDSRQVSLKHGLPLGEAATLESELAYSSADLQLPGAMDGALYQQFVETGEQAATSEPFRNSGRYSQSVFFNSKYEQRLGAFTLRPRLYYNQWTHRHPVTGAINVTNDWTRAVGTDLEAQHAHALWGVKGTLVAGLTAKAQWNDDVRKYEYRDVVYKPGTTRIDYTTSDAQGDLMETQSQRNVLAGVFAQETLQPHERVLVDLGLRLDRSSFRIRQDELTVYDYAAGAYRPGAGISVTDKAFDLPAPKAGVSVRVARPLSVYASIARASQVPSESEIVSAPDLNAAVTTAYEVGVKVRGPLLGADLAAYRMDVADEIVSVVENGQTRFQNAGSTLKRGIEASASVRLPADVEVGASYGFADYTYADFQEIVRLAPPGGGAPVPTEVDRSGNQLPYVPRHQWGAFAAWRHRSGLRLRVQTNTWGEYFLDNANSATYPGYLLLTNVGAAWALGRHELVVDATNVFDDHYAMQVVKDTNGKITYSAATPRMIFLGYRFHPGGRP